MPRHEDDAFDTAETDRVRGIISQMVEADFELLDPPSAIWDGIEAAVSQRTIERSPKVPPSRVAPTPTAVEYWIDGDDVVAGAGGSWVAFATENDAPELADPARDRTLWAFMDRDEVREPWQLLVQRVRSRQAEVSVPFRCDGPNARRWFEMTLTPLPDDGVHFSSVLVHEEPRPPIALLDRSSDRDAEAPLVPLCSWCGRGQHEARWLDIEDLIHAARLLERTSPPAISYGICGVCREDMSAQLLVPGQARRPSG